MFPPESLASLSPKLRWLAEHGLETEKFALAGLECDLTGEVIPNWVCRKKLPADRQHWYSIEIAPGDTEEEACAAYAQKNRKKLWNEETP